VRGAAARLAEAFLRGGVPPELAELGLPRADSRGVWVGKGLRDTRSPPGAFAGLWEVCGGACYDGGGSARLESPTCVHACCPGIKTECKRILVRARS